MADIRIKLSDTKVFSDGLTPPSNKVFQCNDGIVTGTDLIATHYPID